MAYIYGHRASSGPTVARLIKKNIDTDKLVQAWAFLDHYWNSGQSLAEMFGDKDAAFYFDTDLPSYPEAGNDNVSSAKIERWIAELQARKPLEFL